MSTVMVGHLPNSHHIAGSGNQLSYYIRSGSPDQPQPVVPRDEALLAMVSPSGSLGTFLLPEKETQVEKALGYGAFGVVWSVVDPRDGAKMALKRIPRVFHNSVTAKRVYRELQMLCHLNHDNIIAITDIVKTENYLNFNELYILCELMQTDLHKIIVSPQPLSGDHVKIFLYQILRGVKYLHSSHVIHRDIKPGNMLVNSNCLLKICDFGLARVRSQHDLSSLTQEVVTQYYRPPELLMEAVKYSYAVDMWSVGCTFAELLGRRILFQARGPLEQLELIMNLTGTPSALDLRFAHPNARNFILSRKPRSPNLAFLCSLGTNATESALHLLWLMLQFNPDNRATASEALSYSYLEEARLRYHSCMCSCCTNAQSGGVASSPSRRQFCTDLEPSCHMPLAPELDAHHFRRIPDAKKLVWELISDFHEKDDRNFRVILNTNAKNYKALVNSRVAQAKEAPNNHRW